MQSQLLSREAAAIELALETLRRAGTLRLRVTGSSMLPSVHPGDQVTVRACACADVQPGDIALFHRDGRLFAHRVLRHEGGRVITQGDSVPRADAPVASSELLGRVVDVARGRHGPALLPRDGAAARAAAWLFRRCAWAARLYCRAQARYAGRRP